MLVGPPGVYKTTAMKFAGDILEKIKFLNPAPNITTQAALLKRLVDTKDSSIYIFAKEFSDLVMKSEGEMYEFLTSMYDGDARFEAETISRSIELANNPSINLFAATTPGWISASMPLPVIEGGFASRCIFVCEEEPRFKKLYYHEKVNLDKVTSDMMLLVDDLKHIANVKGRFKIESDALKYMEEWHYNQKIPTGTKMASYYNRKAKHAHTIAMLLKLAQTDELVLTIEDFKDALLILEKLEPNMHKVFGGVGKNPYTGDMRGILSYIEVKAMVTKKEVLQTFEASAAPPILEQLLDGLVKMGKLKIRQINQEICYEFIT